MATKPLDLDLIEQGRLVARFREELRRASRYLASYIGRHGQAAVGAKYTLKAPTITFHVGDRGRVDIVTGRAQHQEPGEPGETTIARACMYGEGQYDLFVPVSGSSADPEQAKLFTEDGRTLQ